MRDMQHLEMLIQTKYWEGSTKAKKKLTDTGADGRQILRWILGKIKVYEIRDSLGNECEKNTISRNMTPRSVVDR
jgi:hypothetical protein